MFNSSIITKKTSESSDLELEINTEVESMEEFDLTKVEPSNFTRKTLLECNDCLSYL